MGKSTIKNKRAEIMVIVISAVLVAVIFTMLIRFNKNKEFVYNKHLDETVISIDDENITLKEFSYYVYIVEKQVNDMAIKYNPDDILKILLTVCSQGIMLNNWRKIYVSMII